MQNYDRDIEFRSKAGTVIHDIINFGNSLTFDQIRSVVGVTVPIKDLLNRLVEAGYLEKDEKTQRYRSTKTGYELMRDVYFERMRAQYSYTGTS
jgi:predicted transcriptional regulator